MSRLMAVVNTVAASEAIEGKDRIVLYSFIENDWKIIDQAGAYKAGDLIVRIEVDALLPIKPEYEFLRKNCYSPKFDRFRIRAMRIGGVISQGLLLPLKILPEGNYKSGSDVTEILDVLKYEDAEDASPKSESTKLQYPLVKILMDHKSTRFIGKAIIKVINSKRDSGGFPTNYISKTDETILQNYKGLLSQWAETESYFSLKCEGKSSTFIIKPSKGLFGRIKLDNYNVCSRNNAYKIKDGNEFWLMDEKYDIRNKILKYYKDTGKLIAIQAELIGPGIQGNIYRLASKEIRMFTAKDILTGKLLNLNELINFSKEYDIPMVPILKVAKLKDVMPDIETALKISFMRKSDKDHMYEGFSEALNLESWIPEDILNEGLVIRGLNNEFSFKVRNPQYVKDGPTSKY